MSLDELRKKINAVDQKIVPLLNERAELSLSVGKNKLKNKTDVYAPHREKEVFKRVADLNDGPMIEDALHAVYREIMSGSIALEKPLEIAYFGLEGSFTHLAAMKKFGKSLAYVSCPSIDDVFLKVEKNECDYGVVPIENSIEGAVTPTFDRLVDSELKVCSQILMKITHCLLSQGSIKNIKKIYSHTQPFAQCRQWLRKNMPHVDLLEVSSTSLAAQKASEEKGAAAIGSLLAAEYWKLKILKKNIQDLAHNTTRFLVLSKQDVPSTGKDQTIILFSIKDKVGALHSMLTPFIKNKINLTKIESRPSKKRAWDYYFFVEFEGHQCDKNVSKALSDLEGMCQYLKVVGSYPVV